MKGGYLLETIFAVIFTAFLISSNLAVFTIAVSGEVKTDTSSVIQELKQEEGIVLSTTETGSKTITSSNTIKETTNSSNPVSSVSKSENKPTKPSSAQPPKQETKPPVKQPVKNINLSDYKEIRTYDTLTEREETFQRRISLLQYYLLRLYEKYPLSEQ